MSSLAHGSEIGFLFHDSLVSRLSRNELSVEDLLNEDRTLIRAIKREEPKISTFIADNASDLLEYALGNDARQSYYAMKIISQENKKIISALCKCDLLKNPDDIDESRMPLLANILFLCISTYPEKLYHEFQNICHYIDFIHHSCILSLFEDLIKAKVQIPTMLADLDFIPELIERFTPENSQYIYRLFEICSQNEFLANDMTAPLTISFIIETFSETNVSQWKTIIALLPKFEHSFFESLISKAVSVLDISGSRYEQYQVGAMGFLIEHLKINKEAVKTIDVHALLTVLVSIYDQFPNHSLALMSMFKLISVLVSITETRKIVLHQFFPILIRTINTSHNIVQLSLSYDFCRQIRDLCLVDDEVDIDITNEEEFLEICRTTVNDKDDILESEYGGKHSKYSFKPCISFDDLSDSGPLEIE